SSSAFGAAYDAPPGARFVHQMCTRERRIEGLKTKQVPMVSGLVSGTRACSAERGGFEPPRPLSEPNGLANRSPAEHNPIYPHRVSHSSAPAFPFPCPTETVELAPDLATVVAAWPHLAEAVRAGIVAMVEATAASSTPPAMVSTPARRLRKRGQ